MMPRFAVVSQAVVSQTKLPGFLHRACCLRLLLALHLENQLGDTGGELQLGGQLLGVTMLFIEAGAQRDVFLADRGDVAYTGLCRQRVRANAGRRQLLLELPRAFATVVET